MKNPLLASSTLMILPAPWAVTGGLSKAGQRQPGLRFCSLRYFRRSCGIPNGSMSTRDDVIERRCRVASGGLLSETPPGCSKGTSPSQAVSTPRRLRGLRVRKGGFYGVLALARVKLGRHDLRQLMQSR